MQILKIKKSDRRVILLSSVTAFVLLLLCYVVTNLGFSIAGEGGWVSKVHTNLNKVMKTNQQVPDSILFVNIAYDKELVPISDADGFPVGVIDITNRDALYKFLKVLQKRNDYKYIFLDVFFEEGYESPNDKNLFPLISKMRDLDVSRHRDAKLGNAELLWKHAFISDYTVTKKSSSFMKYELLPDSDRSVVLHMYNQVTGRDIKNHGLFYTDGGKLCNSTLFAKQRINFKSPYDDDGNKNYYNLTTDLLEDEAELFTTPLLKNKYIFIGSMELNDIHGTSEGSLPGVVISANTFLSVMNGQHIIPIVMIIVLFLVLFLVAYQVYSGKTIAAWVRKLIERRRWKINAQIVSYLLTWVSYMSILSIACIVSYLVYGVVYDVFFTATIFQHIDFIVSNKEKLNKARFATIKNYLLSIYLK